MASNSRESRFILLFNRDHYDECCAKMDAFVERLCASRIKGHEISVRDQQKLRVAANLVKNEQRMGYDTYWGGLYTKDIAKQEYASLHLYYRALLIQLGYAASRKLVHKSDIKENVPGMLDALDVDLTLINDWGGHNGEIIKKTQEIIQEMRVTISAAEAERESKRLRTGAQSLPGAGAGAGASKKFCATLRL